MKDRHLIYIAIALAAVAVAAALGVYGWSAFRTRSIETAAEDAGLRVGKLEQILRNAFRHRETATPPSTAEPVGNENPEIDTESDSPPENKEN